MEKITKNEFIETLVKNSSVLVCAPTKWGLKTCSELDNKLAEQMANVMEQIAKNEYGNFYGREKAGNAACNAANYSPELSGLCN